MNKISSNNKTLAVKWYHDLGKTDENIFSRFAQNLHQLSIGTMHDS